MLPVSPHHARARERTSAGRHSLATCDRRRRELAERLGSPYPVEIGRSSTVVSMGIKRLSVDYLDVKQDTAGQNNGLSMHFKLATTTYILHTGKIIKGWS